MWTFIAGLEGDRRRVMLFGDEREGTDETDRDFQAASLDLASCLQVLAAPSSFGVIAIARAIVLRYFIEIVYHLKLFQSLFS